MQTNSHGQAEEELDEEGWGGPNSSALFYFFKERISKNDKTLHFDKGLSYIILLAFCMCKILLNLKIF
jgi:hypothetical protein